MLDFGTTAVPEHVDDDTAYHGSTEGMWSVIDGHDPEQAMDVACRIPTASMSVDIAQARLRKSPESVVWVVSPNGTKVRILRDATTFDAAGNEVGLAMATQDSVRYGDDVAGADR
jgi:hypothetical protein